MFYPIYLAKSLPPAQGAAGRTAAIASACLSWGPFVPQVGVIVIPPSLSRHYLSLTPLPLSNAGAVKIVPQVASISPTLPDACTAACT